jgi:hypothetical protein
VVRIHPGVLKSQSVTDTQGGPKAALCRFSVLLTSDSIERSLMTRRSRPNRPDSALSGAAELVKYEIDMLDYTRRAHSSPTAEAGDGGKNMALESFLPHFRNLRAFLCPSLQSYSRLDHITVGEQKWDVATMTKLMLEELEHFFGMLAPTERAWFPPLQSIAELKARWAKTAPSSTATGRAI